MGDIHAFFNKLRLNTGAIWLEDDTIKVFIPKKLQNQQAKDFIVQRKSLLRSILKDNYIFSKEKFLSTKIFRDNIATCYPLSLAQERLWFIEQYEGGTNAYHMPMVFELADNTAIDGVKYAIQQIVSRHEVLRSTIDQGDQQNGMQIVHDATLKVQELTFTNQTDLEILIKKEIHRPFSLSNEYPIRVVFYKLASMASDPDPSFGRKVVLINIHHIAVDGWSLDILQNELIAYYEAYIRRDTMFRLPNLQIQYKDYALWQRSYLTGEILENQLAYWKQKLLGYQTLQLPKDHRRPGQIDYRGAQKTFQVNKELSRKIRSLTKHYGVTLHSVLLSGFNILMSKYTGQQDILIGSPIANRHHRETEGLIGFFVNMQVHRTLLSRIQSYEELITQVHQDQIAAQVNQDVPFEKLVEALGVERDTSRHPLFQVLFSVQSFADENKLPDSHRKYFKRFQGTVSYDIEKFDLSIFINDSAEEIKGQISYAASLFYPGTIGRLIDHYIFLLEQLIDSPKSRYSELTVLRPCEYRQIVYDWNRTGKDFKLNQTIHELFEEQVARTPDAIALVYEGRQLTYKELNERSNQLARRIRATYRQQSMRELTPNIFIALCLDRSLEMVVGILGVLKAGGAYVPIDPSYPEHRIMFMLEDTESSLVLTQKDLIETKRICLPEEKIVYIDLTEALYQQEETSNLTIQNSGADLAYVIYTSGTTGRPKGVMVEHRNYLQLNAADHYNCFYAARALWTSYTFDVSVFEIFSALLQGSRLFILSNDVRNNSRELFYFLERHRINYTYIPPFFIRDLADHLGKNSLSHLSRILTGVDKVYTDDASKIVAKNIAILNGYGPTETTICSTAYLVESPLSCIGDHLPIGAPLSNEQVYVLDQYLVPVPIGVTGELYIGGAGLARGYLNNDPLTNERFIQNPFATEKDTAQGYTRLYRTGDLVRWLPGGELDYLGRNDEQVKLRGYRIELGEIEAVLNRVAGIGQSCVVVRERPAPLESVQYLVGYYVLDKTGAAPTEAAVLAALEEVLPSYMVPGAVMELERLPLTRHGKLDKKALPDPQERMWEGGYVAARTATEKQLCAIWAEVLGLDAVGVRDNFFAIGGSSILAIRVSHRMSEALGARVTVADVFKYKTIGQLLEHRGAPGQPSIPKSDADWSVLSFAQDRLWFIEQYEGGTNAYHIPAIFELNEATDIEGVKYAISKIVERHEVLRSTIEKGELEQGRQVVHTKPLPLEEMLLMEQEDCERLINEAINCPFDLSKEYPLRVNFYRLRREASSERTIVLINFHHIASDGWSMEIFLQELLAYYEAYMRQDREFELPALEIQYKDYAQWQRLYLTQTMMGQQLEYWKNKLSGYCDLSFPADHPRPPQKDYKGSLEVFRLSPEVSGKLRQLSKEHGATVYSVMLSSVNILLSKYTGQQDIVLGSPIANRHYRQTEGLIGFFVNTQVIRTQLSATQCYAELIVQVQDQQAEAQQYQDLPFEKLVVELDIERDLSRHPIFQVLFTMQRFGEAKAITDVQKKYFKPYEGSPSYAAEKFDLSIFMNDSQEAITGHISYATSLFERATITRLIGHYLHLLEQLTSFPQKPYSAMSLLGPSECKKVLYEWNRADKEYPREKTVQVMFEEQVARTPDAIALVFEEEALTYQVLNERSNQLARYIRTQYQQRTKQELRADTPIGLCVERGLEMVVGILGVLKAGGAYVPMDPSYPSQRIAYMLEDTGAVLVLTQRSVQEQENLLLPAEKVLYIDLSEALYQQESTCNLLPQSTACDLVYVIYTSGTTGHPKGVMLEQFSVCNRLAHIISYSNIRSTAIHLFKTNYVFDASFFELFTHLSVGATLRLTKSVFDIHELLQLLSSTRISSLHLVPSQYEPLSPAVSSSGLEKIYFSGEALTARILSDIAGRLEVYNYYGPTELGEITVFRPERPEEAGVIGQVFPNSRQYVLDGHGVPVPIGVTGELYIGGDGLARGYLNKPGLTAERFIENPFATEADKAKGYSRLYKTGDLVRWLPDGNLEYIGRNDEQVKIRGHRVELSEIEQALTQLEGITQSCVLVKERQVQSGSMKYLVGYYASAADRAAPTPVWIEEQLSKILPDYMVPDALVAMDAFPLTKNGKLDRHALPEPDFRPSEEYIAPRTAVEAAVCRIWEEVLGVERISIKDNFFRIGGNSMLAITIIARIQKALSVELTVKELFLNTTIDLLSMLIQKNIDAEKQSPGHSYEIQPESLYGNESLYEALYSQNWRYSEYLAGSYSPMNLIIKKEFAHVDEKAMSMAVDSLVARHESLRTLFLRRDGKTMQKICSEKEFASSLSLEDVCAYENKMDRIIAMINELVTYRFDFQNEQSFKCKLIKYDTGRYVFIFVIDHIISDAQSTVIIEQELLSLYNAYCQGLDNPLAPIKVQLKDYSYYHNQHYKGDKLAGSQLYFRTLFKDVPPKLRLKPTIFLDGEALHAELNASDVSVIPANSKGRGYVFSVSKEVLEEMKSLAFEQNTSFFNLILAAYCLFLNRISGQFDFSIHSPMSTRNNEDYSKIIGWVTGELFLRVKINEDHNYKDLLRSTQDVIVNSLDHIYYQDVVNLLNIEWDQLVTAQLNLINDINNPDATSAEFEPVHYIAGHVSSSINFNVVIHENGISFNCTYKCAVIHPDRIAEICDIFVNVLRLVLKSPELKMKYWATTSR